MAVGGCSTAFLFNVMNNQAAKTVSDALLEAGFHEVEIGGMVYTIKPPTIKLSVVSFIIFSISA